MLSLFQKYAILLQQLELTPGAQITSDKIICHHFETNKKNFSKQRKQ